LTSDHKLNLSFKILPYNLYIEHVKAIPLYDKGSLPSAVDDFGIGLIIHLFQTEDTISLSKQTLNKACKNTEGILSQSVAFLSLALSIAFLTSSIDIWLLNDSCIASFSFY
jgi:hypothetical protein